MNEHPLPHDTPEGATAAPDAQAQGAEIREAQRRWEEFARASGLTDRLERFIADGERLCADLASLLERRERNGREMAQLRERGAPDADEEALLPLLAEEKAIEEGMGRWMSESNRLERECIEAVEPFRAQAGEQAGPLGAYVMGIVAHDAPKPLWALRSFCELESWDEVGEMARRGFRSMAVSYGAAPESLSARFLSLSEKPGARGSVATVRDGVQRAFRSLCERHPQAGVGFRVDVRADSVPEQEAFIPWQHVVVEMVRELVGNALKVIVGAGRTEGEVQVRVGRDPRDVVVTVRDDGPGIPEGFDVFAGETTTEALGGTGRGLGVTRQTAEQLLLGGLQARNATDGPGAVFTLRVRRDSDAPQAAPAAKPLS